MSQAVRLFHRLRIEPFLYGDRETKVRVLKHGSMSGMLVLLVEFGETTDNGINVASREMMLVVRNDNGSGNIFCVRREAALTLIAICVPGGGGGRRRL
jgi:hypothetical protein